MHTIKHHFDNTFKISKRHLSCLFFGFLFIFGFSHLSAQSIDFCGELPPNTAVSTDPHMICFDRFGNTYDLDVLEAEFDNSSRSRSIVGYFDLSMDLDHEMEAVIEDVFDYLSTVIIQRTNETGCEDEISGALARITITEATLNEGVLASASPMYFFSHQPGCDDVLMNMMDLTINGGLNDLRVDGTIRISNDEEFTFYTGSGSPGSGEFDLYSIILHEALHLLGFASLLDETGSSVSGFHSVWDQFLHTTTAYVNGGPSLNMEPLLISDCEINCWVMNDAVFEDEEEFVSALEDHCSISGSIDFVFGEDAIAPLDGTSAQVLSSLSHLNGTCNGQNINYVMKPGIAPGEVRRTISGPENDILCQLGYRLDDYCNLCYLTVLPEDLQVMTIESCCDIYYDACVGQQKLILFEDLLCNDFSGDAIEITDYYTLSGSGLSVSIGVDGFLVTPSLQGIRSLYYTVQGCECRMLNGHVDIYVGPCTDCEEIDPCENLVCVEDFEEFDPGYGLYNMHYQACGFVWFTERGDNSLDICEDGNGDNFLNIASTSSNREGFCMRLSEPLEPGCVLNIEFDAAARMISGYDWYISVDPPCDYRDAHVFTNGDPVDCGAYSFQPFYLGQTKVSNSPTTTDFPCVDEPNLQPYTFQRPNIYDISANYLILFPTQSSLPHPLNLLDNIIVTKVCLEAEFTFIQDEEECLEIHFTSAGSESVDQSWNFGDSNTSTLADPVHEYMSSGSYTVTHTVTDACGNSSSQTHNIIIEGCCEDYVVTTNTTWTTSDPIPNDGVFHTLTIQAGVSLNIVTGVELKFCPGGSMVVEAGAFVRNKGTLTSLTSINWEGVFVEGNPAVNQLINCGTYSWAYGCLPQGFFWADANSLIENATVGLRNYGPGFNQNGGLIRATGATFKNNSIGMDFRPYLNFNGSQPLPDRSSFRDCLFTNTSTYKNQHPFSAFLQMNGVNGIKINGCEFTNEYIPTNAFHYEDFGRGIFAVSSGFDVVASNHILPCLPPNDCGSFCSFNGLGHGIYISQVDGMRPHRIVQADFENCWRGITSDAASGGTILFNQFNFGSTPTNFTPGPEDQIGIQLQGEHAGFEIQENSFVFDHEGTTNSIGFRVNGIGIAPNIIRRNYFSELMIPHEAFGKNALNSEVNGSGLRFLCEEMVDTHVDGADFFIPETGVIDNIYQIQGVGEFNGLDIIAAGNEFSTTAIHIQNDNDPIEDLEESLFYYWYDATNQEPTSGFGWIERETEIENHCAADYCAPPCIGVADIADEKEKYRDAIDLMQEYNDDYIIAVGEEDFETAEEKSLLISVNRSIAFQAAYNLVHYFWSDTNAFNVDTLLAWYAKMDYYGADLLAAGEIARKLGYDDAIVYLEDIPLNRILLPEEENDIDKIITIYSMLDTSDVYDLSSNQRNAIRSIAQASKGTSSSMARSVLAFYGEHFPLPYYLNEVTRPAVAYRSDDSTKVFVEPLVSLQVMPIPADDEILVKWDVNVSADHLILTDYLGRVLRRTDLSEYQDQIDLDVSQYSAGLYFATLVMTDHSTQTVKFIIR